MTKDLLDFYSRASEWTLDKVKGAAAELDTDTPCDKWDVRELMNHMLETQQYFVGSARGEDASPPGQTPPTTLLGEDPVSDFKRAREETMRTFGDEDVQKKTGPALGIAFADQLLHGWDLAEAAYETIHGQFTDEQRKGVFKPEIEVGADASAQDKLLAYTGRDPKG